MVYGVSGQRMAWAVIIVIYHDGISIVHVLSQVHRSCTKIYRCREPFLCPPRAVPLDLQTNLVAEALVFSSLWVPSLGFSIANFGGNRGKTSSFSCLSS